MGNNWTKGREPLRGRAMQPAPWMWQEANANFMMQFFSMMEMQSSSIKVLHHKSRMPTASLSGSTHPIDGMQVAQRKKTLATTRGGRRDRTLYGDPPTPTPPCLVLARKCPTMGAEGTLRKFCLTY